MGVETIEYKLSFKVNKFKIFLKSLLNFFKKFLGKISLQFVEVCSYAKKNSKLINENDTKYWDLVHKRHSLYQKDGASYKDFFKSKDH